MGAFEVEEGARGVTGVSCAFSNAVPSGRMLPVVPLFLPSAGNAPAWVYVAVFWGAYALWMGPEIAGNALEGIRTRRSSHPGERRFDAGSGAVIMAGIFLLPVAVIELARLVTRTAIPADRGAVFVAGICLMLLGVVLRWYAVRSLGRQFSRSVAIQEGHELVASGPYRYIRHPSYSGTMLTLFGLGAATDNWVSLAVMALGGLAVYSYRVTVEERVLVREIGEPYLRYMRRTKRFIPWLL